MTDEAYMRLAIDEALRGKAAGEFPFGAILVDPAGEIVLSVHDTVERDGDRTSHAETMLVKHACRKFGPDLAGYAVYTTTEPCPMCFTTCWLGGISKLVYGCTMRDVYDRTGGAVDELGVPAIDMNARASRRIELVGGVLRGECLAMFERATTEAALA